MSPIRSPHIRTHAAGVKHLRIDVEFAVTIAKVGLSRSPWTAIYSFGSEYPKANRVRALTVSSFAYKFDSIIIVNFFDIHLQAEYHTIIHR